MAGPLDVSPLLQVGANFNPLAAVQQGQQVGNGILNAQAQGEQRAQNNVAFQQQNVLFDQAQQDRQRAIEMATQKAIADAQMQQQMRADIEQVAKAPSTDGIATLMVKYPQLADNYKKAHDALNTTEQQERQQQSAVAYSALIAGQKEIAAARLRADAEAYKAANRPKDASALTSLADLVERNPDAAKSSLGLYLSATMGPEKFASTFTALEENPEVVRTKAAEAKIKETEARFAEADALLKQGLTQAQIDKTFAETKKISSEVGLGWAELRQKAAQFQAKLAQTAGTIAPAMQKKMDESATAAATGDLQAARMRSLADKFDKATEEGNPIVNTFDRGIAADIGEGIASKLGYADVRTEIRRDFTANREKFVAAALKGSGAVTENEREAFRKGVPPPTASDAQIASWLRKNAQAIEDDASVEAARAEWISQNKNLDRAKQPIRVGDATIPEGTSYPDAVKFLTISRAAKAAEKGSTAPAGEVLGNGSTDGISGASRPARAPKGSKGPPPASLVANLKARGLTKEQAAAELTAQGYSLGGNGG